MDPPAVTLSSASACLGVCEYQTNLAVAVNAARAHVSTRRRIPAPVESAVAP
jgi:hypothetical protein